MSPIAKKFTTSRENRSKVPHRSKSLNSSSEDPATLNAVFPVCIGLIGSIWKLFATCSEIPELLSHLNPLMSAVMKINEILSAATVTTGAKISLITLPISRCLLIFPNAFSGISLSNTFLRTKNGDAAIYSQSNPILAISTIASAINGKKSAIASQVLMRKIPDVSPRVETFVSVSCAKLSKEEYIVTSGPTNPLDLSISCEIVVEVVWSKNMLPVESPPVPFLRLTNNHVTHHCVSHQL